MSDPIDPSKTAPTPAGPEHTNPATTPTGGDSEKTVTLPVRATGGITFAPPSAPGDLGTLGPYRIVRELGHGGMGAVFLAVDTRLDRKLALKVMLPEFAANPAAKERFLREARTAAQVAHDNVVTIFEADERGGTPFIAMQHLQGSPLDDFLKKNRDLSVQQILRIAYEAATGLAAAHEKGLVHRDIKPGNLWLEAPNGRVKVLDFGLARPVTTDSELTRSGAVVGTPAFMSPEQGRGLKVDHRTDLFSLGAVLYRLCTGRNPFTGPTVMAVLMALGNDEPPPVRELNPAVPESLAQLVHQLLSKSPERRPHSAEEVARRLYACATQVASGTALPQVTPHPGHSGAAYPHPGYAPVQVTPHPESRENSAFANLDATHSESADESTQADRDPPARGSTGRGVFVVAGLAFLAAVGLALGIVAAMKKGPPTVAVDRGEPRPADRQPTGKPPKAKPPTLTAGPNYDRQLAEYVLANGGTVWVNGGEPMVAAVADRMRFGARFLQSEACGDGFVVAEPNLLPREPFTVTGVGLDSIDTTPMVMENFKDCKSLLVLNLVGTRITEAGLASLAGGKNLRVLTMSRATVDDKGLSHFRDCKGLTYLDVGDTRVTDAGLANFADYRTLTTLSLYATDATDKGVANFKNCKDLSLLVLAKTKVTDAGMDHVKAIPGLRRLSLTDTAVTAAKVRELLEALPDCLFEWNGKL